MKGGKTTLEVQSPTPNAEVTIKSAAGPEVYNGPAPAKVLVSKEQMYFIEVKADGYKPRKQVVTKSVSGWMFGNIVWIVPVFWGVGIAVDAMTGSLWTLDPETQTIALVKAAEPPPANSTNPAFLLPPAPPPNPFPPAPADTTGSGY